MLAVLAATAVGGVGRLQAASVADGIGGEGEAEFLLPGAYVHDGTLIAPRGVVIRHGEVSLIADGLRYDFPDPHLHTTDTLWARGHVVLVRPGIRITADQLGLRHTGLEGEAWHVRIEAQTRRGTFVAEGAHLRIEADQLQLEHAHIDFGYGGLLSIDCPLLHVVLPPKPRAQQGHDTHAEAKAYVDSITLRHPTVRVLAVPVLWAPVLYRDFRYDEPWSRVVFGSSKRLGDFVHLWVGENLPTLAGWRLRVEARGDENTTSGQGAGANVAWSHERFGSGGVELFEMPHEHVIGGVNDDEDLGTRHARLVDAEHQTDLGPGDLSLRYVEEPAPDPGTPPTSIGGANERFRADYFPLDLDQRPFARQGGGLAYSFPWGTLVTETQHNPRPEWTLTQDFFSVRLASVPMTVAGPVVARVDAWEQDLHQVWADTSADRLRADASLGFLEWLPGGIGVDATAGGRSLRYDNGIIQGVHQEGSQEAHVAFLDAGLRLRLEDDQPGWMHVLTPRIGIELTSPAFGQFLPGYGFGDQGDVLNADQRYYTVGFDTAYTSVPRQFRAQLVTRWAMREQDRLYTDPTTGLTYRGATRFADISATGEGTIGKRLTLTGEATYDDRPRRFTDLNASGSLTVTPHLILRDGVALNTALIGQPVPPPDNIANTPGITCIAGRYRYDLSATLTPGGRPVDGYLLQVGRQMVDGTLTLSYEIDYNQQGQLYDQRFGVSFSLLTGNQQTGPVGHGASYALH